MTKYAILTIGVFLFEYTKLLEAAATPTYKYLKELCPPGLLPLTGKAHVRTCNDVCPFDARCIQGICCLKPPTCIHTNYKFPTGYSCLPKMKQNCPAESNCVPSSRVGMNICCTDQQPKLTLSKYSKAEKSSITSDNGVCPASYPVIRHEKNHIVLCKECSDGICVPFRGSDVSVCCQSYVTLCGVGSEVQMDGLLARDCSQRSCSPGYECSTTSSGAKVCCSFAVCSSGQRARSVCAGGCRLDEKCEEIKGQRWCCPHELRQLKCPNGRRSNGEQCSLLNPTCSGKFTCTQSADLKSFICCESDENVELLSLPSFFLTTTSQPVTTSSRRSRATIKPLESLPTTSSIKRRVTMVTTTPAPTTRRLARPLPITTDEDDDEEEEDDEDQEDGDDDDEDDDDDEEEIVVHRKTEPMCKDGSLPMTILDTYLNCPEEGAPCPRAGFTCQTTSTNELFCCPLTISNWIIATTETLPKKASTTTQNPLRGLSSLVPIIKPISLLPKESDPPTCWFGQESARNDLNDEIRRCSGFFDLSCPFGFKCLPSASTTGFLCCKG